MFNDLMSLRDCAKIFVADIGSIRDLCCSETIMGVLWGNIKAELDKAEKNLNTLIKDIEETKKGYQSQDSVGKSHTGLER